MPPLNLWFAFRLAFIGDVVYYHNMKTNETTWKKPKELKRREQAQTQIAKIQRGRMVRKKMKMKAATAEAATMALPGGTHHAYDAVILATGFRHRMADFLCAKDGLLHTAASFGAADDAEGAPIIDSCSRSRVIDSIYFVGMDQFRSTTSLDWPP
jgi:hypothetical protein